jgi:hypothetical protein
METIEELVPLTAEDIKKLEIQKTKGGYGCLWFSLVVFLLAAAVAYYNYGFGFWWFLAFAIIAGLFLILTVGLFLLGPGEDRNVLLDIKEGKKLRIVAPIESKEIIEIKSRRIPGLSSEGRLLQAAADSYEPLNLEYSIKVGNYTFKITEEQYLTSFRKGDFIEFFATPHSKTILSPLVELHE